MTRKRDWVPYEHLQKYSVLCTMTQYLREALYAKQSEGTENEIASGKV